MGGHRFRGRRNGSRGAFGVAALLAAALVAATAVATRPVSAATPPSLASSYPLPPGPAPLACVGLWTGVWPDIRDTATGLPCYLEAQSGGSHVVMTGPNGQTITQGQYVSLAIDDPRGGFTDEAAWLLSWSNLFDYQPLMRGSEGTPANSISGFNQHWVIPAQIDNADCYDTARGFLQGRWRTQCNLWIGKGPYYGTPGGIPMPWTMFTAATQTNGTGWGGNTPIVTNCGGTCGPQWGSQFNKTELPVFFRPSPYAGFTQVVNNASVQFTNGTLSDLPVTRTDWDFGDGTTSPWENPEHTYAAPGSYTVSLTVQTSDGQTDTWSTTVTIAPFASLSLSASASPAVPTFGQTVTVTYTVFNWGGVDVDNVFVTTSASSSAVTSNGSPVPWTAFAAIGSTVTFTEQFTYWGGVGTVLALAQSGGGGPGSVVSNFAEVEIGTPLTAPSNDNFANATAVSGTSGTRSGTVVSATVEPSDPIGAASAHSVWYRYTPASSGTVTFDTCTTTVDTLIGVYTGNTIAALTPVVTGDDGCPNGSGSSVSFAATGGVTYHIEVAGKQALTGTFTLQWARTALGTSGPPIVVAHSSGDGWINVAFAPNLFAGSSAITSYTITTTPATTTTVIAAPGQRATLTGLDNATTYTFVVKATNAAGVSAPSVAVALAPLAGTVGIATVYDAAALARLQMNATYFGQDLASAQKTSTFVIGFIVGLIPPGITPVPPPAEVGSTVVTTNWSVAEQSVLTTVAKKYALTPGEAQQFSVALVGFLLALGGH